MIILITILNYKKYKIKYKGINKVLGVFSVY